MDRYIFETNKERIHDKVVDAVQCIRLLRYTEITEQKKETIIQQIHTDLLDIDDLKELEGRWIKIGDIKNEYA